MSANNSASLSSVVVVGDLFRVTLPGESAFRSHKVTKKVEEGEGEGEGTKTRDVYLPFVALCSWLYQIGGRLTRHELDF